MHAWVRIAARQVVKVTVQTLVTQTKGSSCRDRLLVYDYPGHRGAKLTKLCGTSSLGSDAPRATIYSRSSGIYLNFLSGSNVNMAGFQLKYDFVGECCAISRNPHVIVVDIQKIVILTCRYASA